MANRLTPFSRLLITLIILAALFFGVRYLLNNTDLGEMLNQRDSSNSAVEQTDKPTETESTKSSDITVKDDDVLKVQVFTWGGYAPGIYFNNGFKSSSKSRFTKDYGLKVDFVLIDDFDASRQAWISDEVHLLGNEVSAMASEMARLGPQDPRILMQVDWSRGGDAIIVKRGINTVNDLKGKQVAVTPSTPSQTFLLFALESAGMDLKDIKTVEVPSAIDAATAFRSGQVDAAVVWSPDDVIATRQVPGSKILQSTKEASHIVADVFMVKKSYAEKHPDKLAAFYEGWMRAVAEMNSIPSNMDKAAKLLAEGTELPVEDALGTIQNVRLTTHGDNINFFGKNVNFKGVTGSALYSKMGSEFEKLGFAPSDRPSWREMSYTPAMSAAKLPTGKGYEAEGQKDFKPADTEARTLPAIAVKPITISYPTGSAVLGENAKTIIDLQFADVAKAYGNARIRIEGNTDSTGSRETNLKLSEARAKSVADYLEKAYNMNPNRFIIIGNGPDKPVPGCESNATDDCRAKNRRTEFQLIAQ